MEIASPKSISILHGSHDYNDWIHELNVALASSGWNNYVGDTPPTDPLALSIWKILRPRLSAHIIAHLSRDISKQVRLTDTPKEILDYLKTLYAKHDPLQVTTLREKIYGITYDHSQKVEVFLNDLKRLCDDIKACDPKAAISDEEMVSLTTKRLPPIFSNITDNMRLNKTKLSFKELSEILIETQSDKIQQGLIKDMHQLALYSKDHKGKGIASSSSSSPSNKGTYYQRNQSYKSNGFQRSYGPPSSPQQGPPQRNSNYRPKGPNSFQPKGNSFHQSKGSSQGSFSPQNQGYTRELFCNYCKKKGHTIQYCWKKQSSSKTHASHLAQDTHGNALSVASTSQVSTPWIIDSGASHHMTGSQSSFSSFSKDLDNQCVTIGSGETLQVLGTGNVNISDGHLKDVWYVEGLVPNLVSVYQITNNFGYRILFTNQGVSIFYNERLVASGIVDHEAKLYKLTHIYPSPSGSQYAFATHVPHYDGLSKLWHDRLGHVSFGQIKILLNKHMVKGLPSISTLYGVCEGCVLGKHHMAPFSKEAQHRAKYPLELIHSDVCGPFQVPCISGGLYLLTFIDDFTRKCWIYILKLRSQVFAKFLEFKNMVE